MKHTLAFIFLVVIVLVFVMRRRAAKFDDLLNELVQPVGPNTERACWATQLRSWWFAIGLVLVGCSVVMLEKMRPALYFAQDDVRCGEMPGILLGCRALMHGVWPAYDPYTSMGTPFIGTGLHSLLYPPTLISYLTAKYLLRNEYLTMEVFAVMHIVAGYGVTFLLARRLRLGSMTSMLVSLSFVLSGCNLIMGRGWHSFMPVVTLEPLLLLCAAVFIEQGATVSWTLFTGVIIGAWYQVGFTQIWLYGVASFCLTIILDLLLRGRGPRAGVRAVPALLMGLGLALPPALQQLNMAHGIVRAYGQGEGIKQGLVALLLPYPLVKAGLPNGWGGLDMDRAGAYYFFGGLFALLLLVNVVLVVTQRPERRLWAAQTWAISALIVFGLALGRPGPWSLMLHIPVVKQVSNHPIRLLPFFILFAVLAGGQLLEQVLDRIPRRRIAERILAVPAAAIVMYNVSICHTSFSVYMFPAYPNMPTAMHEALVPLDSRLQERTISFVPDKTRDVDFALSLGQGLADVYQTVGFSGHNPLGQNSPEYLRAVSNLTDRPGDAARAYGLEWQLVEHPIRAWDPRLPEHLYVETIFQYEYTELMKSMDPEHLPIAFREGDVSVRHLDGVDPLAFAEDGQRVPLPITVDCRGVDVDLSSAHGGVPVIVNFLWRTGMRAYVDAVPVRCEPDQWGRMRAFVRSPSTHLQIRYEPTWRLGIILGLVLILLGFAASLISSKGPRLPVL